MELRDEIRSIKSKIDEFKQLADKWEEKHDSVKKE